ncbi:hypothetical protein OC842_003764 [Tilletia horrida]|uniref:Uncharacterized protein n=1 Tax=Tilletia horrida TaxID=155126 RepID=A0AAN6JKG8_9BASI|nr:hypothetical protein OC842_003764 [Tilletia horrida]
MSASGAPRALFPIRALDLHALVRHLSSPRALPASFHVRNRLLHAFLDDPTQFPPAPGSWRLQHDRNPLWDRVLKDGNRGWAAGAVPSALMLAARDQDGLDNRNKTANGDQDEDACWAVFFLSPGFARDASPGQGQGQGQPGRVPIPTPRLDLWLSRPSMTDSTSSALLSDIIERIVPALLLEQQHEGGAAPRPELEPEPAAAERKRVRFMCCSFDESEAESVRRLRAARVARDGDDDAFQIRLDNRCLRFVGSSSSSRATTGSGPTRVLPAGGEWKLDSIEEADIPQVVATNKIPFPASYVRNHRHISSVIRRRCRRPAGEEEEDSWEPVGWTYSHSNLFVASLYVRPEHRTSKIPILQDDGQSTQTQTQIGIGIGTLVTLDLTDKLVQAQRAALAALGLEEDIYLRPSEADAQGYADNPQLRGGGPIGPCDVVGESEEDNLTAHAFVSRGPKFRPAGTTSWMLLDIEVGPSTGP